jgi:tetratricopeptide (TPR) repeat protein
MAGLKDFDAAVEEVEQAIQLDPARGTSYANLGAIRVAQGDREAAREAFRKAVEAEPTSVTAWLAQANFQMADGDTAGTEESLKKALALDGRHVLTNRALAALYLASNRIPEAEAPLRTVVDATDAAAARFALADYYMRISRSDDAQAVLRPLVGMGRDSAGAESRLAQIEYDAKQTNRAHQMLDAILDREPANVAVLVMKSRWLLAEGKEEEALEQVTAATSADPQSASAHYLRGRVQMARRDYDGATGSFTEVLRLNPRASAAELQLSRLHLARGDAAGAVEFADSALKSAPGNPEVRVSLAHGLLVRGDTRQARGHIDALLKEYPKSSVVHALNGTYYGRTNDAARARAAYERALQLNPASLEGMTGIVALDLFQKRIPQARAFVDEQVQRYPDNSDLLVLAARVHAADGDAAKVETLLRQAIQADATNTSAYAMLAQVYMGQRKLDAARTEFDAIVARNPKNVAAATMAAMIVQAQADLPEAKKRYSAILASDSRAAIAANNLAWIYAEEGANLDAALDLARTAVTIMPNRPEVQDTLGWVYYRQDLPGLAIAPFEQSIAQDGANPVYHYHLALALWKTGQIDRARAAADTALKLKPDFTDARTLLDTLKG